MLWDPKIKGKLDVSKAGPYFISKVSPRKNYFLTNCRTHVALKNAIPLRRLEPVADSVTEYDESVTTRYDICKVKSVRGQEPDIEFLVEWKDRPRDRNTWTLERDLTSCPDQANTKRLIDQFKASFRARVGTRQSSGLNTLSLLPLIALFLIFLPLMAATEIFGNFRLCNFNDKSPVINYDFDCHLASTSPVYSQKVFKILERRPHIINGFGHACWAEKITRRSWRMLFFIPKEERLAPQRVLLSESDCWSMIIHKTLFGQSLVCNSDSDCTSHIEPIVSSFPHIGSNFFSSYQLSTSKVHLMSDSKTRPIFARALSPCRPNDFFCIFGESSYVWNSSIIHTCEYFKVKTVTMIGNNHICFSCNSLVQLERKFKACKIDIFSTSEGLFLTDDKLARDFSTEEEDANLEHHLLISDFDKKILDLLELMTSFHVSNKLKFCLNQKFHLQSAETRLNEFFTIFDERGKEWVVFNKDGDLIVAACMNVSRVFLDNTSKKCFSQVPVFAHLSNRSLGGFLYTPDIISNFALRTPCGSSKIINLNDNFRVIYKNGISELTKSNRLQLDLNLISQDISEMSFEHNYDVVMEIKLESIHRLVDSDKLFYIAPGNVFRDSSLGWVDSILTGLASIKWNPFDWSFFKDLGYLFKCLVIMFLSVTLTGVLGLLGFVSFTIGKFLRLKYRSLSMGGTKVTHIDSMEEVELGDMSREPGIVSAKYEFPPLDPVEIISEGISDDLRRRFSVQHDASMEPKQSIIRFDSELSMSNVRPKVLEREKLFNSQEFNESLLKR
jgi:hypothetical protein